MIKSPDIRSAELLDCAQRLFFAHGYQNTTVNDIIREAGVSNRSRRPRTRCGGPTERFHGRTAAAECRVGAAAAQQI
ncbi:helix-turn-helix domain-containing protein [Sinorhizobium fredii]|uniref:helix-turn-helix domain-containing protein n=1 Tax=Rhizobium fredii TaxID=380 RepID=UPI003511595B